jgi:cobalt-zinc-cadmium efflux system outer membrane protein
MGCSIHEYTHHESDIFDASLAYQVGSGETPRMPRSSQSHQGASVASRIDPERTPAEELRPASYQAISPGDLSQPTQPPADPSGKTPDPPGPSDPRPTLDEIINTVLLADPQIRAGFEAINQASGDALQAALRPNPNLSITQTLLPLTRPFTEDAQGGPPQFDVGVSYPIDWFLFGKRAAAMRAAALGVRVSEADFAELIRQRVLEAATTYYDVLEAKALLELARQDAANLKQVEDITQKAVEGGGRPQVELGRIRLDRLRAEQNVRDAENTLVAAKARLQALMGRTDANADFDVRGTLEDIRLADIPPVDEAYNIAAINRPDIAALRWRIQQAQAAVEVERRQAYPEITPQIGYTRQFQRKAIGFPDANSFGFGAEMSLPFYNRNQGNRYRAVSVAIQQQYELQAGLVQLRAEVIQADKELRTVLANAKAVAEEQLKLAAEVRDSLNKAYEAGGRPLIDVLDAQRNFRETYRLYIESRANLGRAGVRFNAVLGKKVTP